jgi:CRISPR system Cascade subunit CasD
VIDYLVFTLYGPLASWGGIAMGEARDSTMYPTRSALIGLLGAACGVDRADNERQRGLRDGYRFGIRVDAFGAPLRDYHTIQYGEPNRHQVFRTRRDELENGRKVGTLLSARQYRVDALANVAVEALAGAPYTLAELRDALLRPTYVLYLGRKSCPPALPLHPKIQSAEDFREALRPLPVSPVRLQVPRRLEAYFWDPGMAAGIEAASSHWCHDQPLSRDRWQFGHRQELRGSAAGEP